MRNSALLLITFLLFIACKDDDDKGPQPPDITYDFKLLKMDGTPATTFTEGENFIFSFRIINASSYDVIFKGMENTYDVFRVFRLGSDNSLDDVGKPYQTTCDRIRAYDRIAASDTLFIELPWQSFPGEYGSSATLPFCPRQTNPLPAGEYYTGFITRFAFAAGDTAPDHITPVTEFGLRFDVE